MWTWNKPTEAGWYFVNNGDVVTDDSFDCVRLMADADGVLRDKDDVPLREYASCYKYMSAGIKSLNQSRNSD